MSEKGPIVHLYNKNTRRSKKMSINKNIQTKLTKGLLDLIILQLLDNQPMHGYQIITTIRKSFGIYFGPSTIYPMLNTMEKKSYIKSEWNMNSERPRKIYKITNGGKTTLNYTACSLKTICKTIATDNTQAQNGIQHQMQLIQHKPMPTEIY
jgi:DNA-binding PadR family transcriptional regulator